MELPTGEVWAYEYTRRDNLAAQVAPDGARYVWEYDALGRLERERNELGDERAFTYDAEGNILARMDFAGRSTTYEHDRLGRLTEEHGWDGEVYRYAYDEAGNMVEADNSASELRFDYDGAGRLAMSEDLLTDESRLVYERDAAGRIVRETWPQAGREARYERDGRGLVRELTDPDGAQSGFSYNERGQMTQRELPDGQRIEQEYDEAGRLSYTASISGSGQVRDAAGYAYSPGGRIAAEIDEQGQWRKFDYDPAGRLESVATPHAERGVREAQFRSFQMAGVLEERDQPTQMVAQTSGGHGYSETMSLPTELQGSLSDVLGQMPSQAQTVSSTQESWKESFAYDERENRESWTTGWGTVDYEYDAANRMLQEGEREYEYDAEGNKTAETLGERHRVDYEYDARGRLIALERRYGAAEDDDHPGQGGGPPDHAGPPGFTPPGHARRGGAPGSNPDWGPSGVANYAYDALGRRAARAVATDSGATHETRTSYRGMGFDIAADHQPLRGPGPDWLRIPGESGDHPGGRHGNSGFRAESIHLQVAGRTVSEHPTAGPETARNYHHDVRGGVRYISATGGRGAPGGEVDYDAFGLPSEGLDRFAQAEGRGPAYGQQADKHGKLAEGYGYTGKRLDPMLGGYDYGFRHFAPEGRSTLGEANVREARREVAGGTPAIRKGLPPADS